MHRFLEESPCLPPETVRVYNSRLAELFSYYLNFMPRALDASVVGDVAKSCDIPLAEAYAHCPAAMADLDPAGEDRLFFHYWLLPALHELETTPYRDDPYFQNIRIPTAASGRWQLKTEELLAFEAFVCNDFVVTKDGRMIPQIGFFKQDYPFPAVLEGGREWMTLQPNEMVTTYPAIEQAHGRVLTFGLGLGYFAYHASQKENVSEVTVVDISGDVIELFKTHILPQFPHKEKIKLVECDAFAFAKEQMPGNFDFAFADIWHDAGDGRELYLKMKEIARENPDIDFSFWLEDTIRCYLDESLWHIPKE
ncbi:MAG: hypothetical protein IKD28_05665 [Clostridia bacterium]|nr:hypothetical protein [Clostridia bacterium]